VLSEVAGQNALAGAVHASVGAGFGAALIVAAFIAVLSSLGEMAVIRTAGNSPS
jgi:hypothetical protein